MAKRNIILAIIVALVLVAAIGLYISRSIPTRVRLELTGTSGLRVTGTYSVDGASQIFNGVLPTEIVTVARDFRYTIRMQEAQGELRGRLVAGEEVTCLSGTKNEFSGVRGQYSRTWGSRSVGCTTIRKEDQ